MSTSNARRLKTTVIPLYYMKVISDLHFHSIPKKEIYYATKSKLVSESNGYLRTLRGDQITYQFRINGLTLLIVEDDYFETIEYWFYLLNENWKILDCINPPESIGYIKNLEVVDENNLRLTFSDFDSEQNYQLTVFEKKCMNFNFNDLFYRRFRFWFNRKSLKFIKTVV